VRGKERNIEGRIVEQQESTHISEDLRSCKKLKRRDSGGVEAYRKLILFPS